MTAATKNQLGHPTCQVLCEELVWSDAEVLRFQTLVADNYGYRMYLDDLPSAITLGEGDTLYEENIPIGFFPSVSQNSYGGLLKETAIFNHLDLKVLVSPAWMTSQELSSDKEDEKINFSLYGYDINVPLPQSAFRITGFEVKPRSIPTGKACTPLMYDHGF
jgi:hypothetical protein